MRKDEAFGEPLVFETGPRAFRYDCAGITTRFRGSAPRTDLARNPHVLASMNRARVGDTVQVHYTGSLHDGTIFDTSRDADPIEFTLGSGQIITGFEQTVIGMEPGETRSTSISPDKAYGPHVPGKMIEIERDSLPPGMKAEIGQWFHGELESGESISFMVSEVTKSTVKLDANHPLAGKELFFDITLVQIL